eukprot:1157218-Pelagomonas_calceolata.AAC.14
MAQNWARTHHIAQADGVTYMHSKQHALWGCAPVLPYCFWKNRFLPGGPPSPAPPCAPWSSVPGSHSRVPYLLLHHVILDLVGQDCQAKCFGVYVSADYRNLGPPRAAGPYASRPGRECHMEWRAAGMPTPARAANCWGRAQNATYSATRGTGWSTLSPELFGARAH